MDWLIAPGGTLRGEARVPGDKSISHRAVMLGALALGRTQVAGFLPGEDTLNTMRAFQAMGVGIERISSDALTIDGLGLRGLKAPAQSIDCGNSGTGMRLLCGLLAGQSFATELIGDASLSNRPMRRVTDPLRSMGADIEARAEELAPLRIKAVPSLRAISYQSPMASAQVKSALLLAGLYADGPVSVHEPKATRDHSERMLSAFGARLECVGTRATVWPDPKLFGQSISVPSDISSAAFFLVGAAISSGSNVLLRAVGMNPRRTGIIDCLRDMGARIDVESQSMEGGEPVADLRVRGAALRGIRVPESRVPDMIDEFPTLMVAAACADGDTTISGAEELRVKESDRLAAMSLGLRALGIEVEEQPDGATIRGGTLKGGIIDSRGDHRIAMSFAMAGLRAQHEIKVLDCKNVDTSFPGFAQLASSMGLSLSLC
jgi:3-phosphoshikimate 1-carboxyvinyltransferase